MRRRDESIKWPFAQEDMADNLIEWAGKMKALGEIWGALSWHIDRYKGDDEALVHCGETLGSIIMDYAGLIEDTVTDNFKHFHDLDKKIVLPLARCREVYDFIGKTRRVEDLSAINYQIGELRSFTENAALPVMRMQNLFEDLKKEIMTQQKSAPAAVSAAAGA